MAKEYTLSYTANEINEKLGKIDSFVNNYENIYVSTEKQTLTNLQKAQVRENIDAQPIGNYLTEIPSEYLKETELSSAVNTALAHAKESGEFNGESVTIEMIQQTSEDGGVNSVYFSDGTRLEVYNGHTGAQGGRGKRGFGILKVATEPTSYTTETAGVKPIKRMEISTIMAEAGVDEVLTGDIILHDYYLYYIYYKNTTYAFIDACQSIRGEAGVGEKGEDGISPTVTVSKSGKIATISITDATGTKTVTVSDGTDGQAGVNGTSVTVKSVSESTVDGGSNVVTFSDGKTVTIKNGTQGSAGKNPVKGTDYWTSADKTEIVNSVLTALPTWTGGSY